MAVTQLPHATCMTSLPYPTAGRTPIPLERGWTAVLLDPLPGAGLLAVGLYRAGKLVEFVYDPEDVAALVGVLTRRLAGRSGTWRGTACSRVRTVFRGARSTRDRACFQC
jgi:hypothetical protein